ncbi:transposase [Pantoea sp. Acro-835]|uniref:Transposase n=1 Tax=Candidatus Pantoea multigeneris TaxID=2608357 RepID=A0ABX0RGY8_9GAMM|nr:transposase [Pantoea multigeneris]
MTRTYQQSALTDAYCDPDACRLAAGKPSRHSELVKAFAYMLNAWEALKNYAGDGWAEADNIQAVNLLRTVNLERKNHRFFGYEHDG